MFPVYPVRHRQRQRVLEEFEAPLGSVLAETAREALLYSPLSSINRMGELSEAESGPLDLGRFLRGEGLRGEPESPMVSAEHARAKVQEQNLDLEIPDEGIRSAALDILIERKSDERRRRDILNRATGGFMAGGARFGVSLAASMLDPINVAASFVPVVGPARYGAMLERAGSTAARMGVRARVGAVEGAAGAAMVEPLVIGATSQEQADYGLTDSLLNLALGTVLGGGLHVGAGAISDAISRGRPWQTARPTSGRELEIDQLPMATRHAALRTAVAQAVDGRRIDVEPIIAFGRMESQATGRMEPAMRVDPGRPSVEAQSSPAVTAPPAAQQRTISRGEPDFERSAIAQERRILTQELPLGERPGQPTSLSQFVAAQGGVRDQGRELRGMDIHRHNVPGVGRLVRENGKTLDHARESAAEAGYFDHIYGDRERAVAQSTIADFLNLLDQDVRGSRVYSSEDMAQVGAAEAFSARQQDRAEMRARIEQITQEADAVLPDDITIRAADIMAAERVDADVAVERAIMEDYYAAGDPPVRMERTDGSELEIPFDDIGGGASQRGEIADGGTVGTGQGARGQDGRASRGTGQDQRALSDQLARLNASAKSSFQAENYRLADMNAAFRADEQLKTTHRPDEVRLQQELDEAMDDLSLVAEAVGMADEVNATMLEFDELAVTAQEYGRAVRAAADCQLRRGA